MAAVMAVVGRVPSLPVSSQAWLSMGRVGVHSFKIGWRQCAQWQFLAGSQDRSTGVDLIRPDEYSMRFGSFLTLLVGSHEGSSARDGEHSVQRISIDPSANT